MSRLLALHLITGARFYALYCLDGPAIVATGSRFLSRTVYWFGCGWRRNLLASAVHWGSLSSESALTPWVSTLIALYTGFPICLWGGYAWGRAMAWVYGLTSALMALLTWLEAVGPALEGKPCVCAPSQPVTQGGRWPAGRRPRS